MIEVEFVGQRAELVNGTQDPVAVIDGAARTCTQVTRHGMLGGQVKAAVRLVRSLVKRGHTSPLEFADADFLFEVDRAIQQELTRHRHFAFNIESTRWVDYRKKPLRFVTKPDAWPRGAVPDWYVELLEELCRISALVYEAGMDANVPRDYARKALLLALASNMRMKGNYHAWLDMLPKRLGRTAHPESRQIARWVLRALKQACAPAFEEVDE